MWVVYQQVLGAFAKMRNSNTVFAIYVSVSGSVLLTKYHSGDQVKKTEIQGFSGET